MSPKRYDSAKRYQVPPLHSYIISSSTLLDPYIIPVLQPYLIPTSSLPDLDMLNALKAENQKCPHQKAN